MHINGFCVGFNGFPERKIGYRTLTYGKINFCLINSQMMRVISSPSISTTGLVATNRLAGAASVATTVEKKKIFENQIKK